jgi:methionyl aminopeptidase
VSAAIAAGRPGRSLNVIGAAVQRVGRRGGYRIVRKLGTHGVGRPQHEEPAEVPVEQPRERRRLAEGLVLTIEPFFTTGPAWVEAGSDGWTLSVPRGELVAQCEHTVVVTRAGALVVTG